MCMNVICALPPSHIYIIYKHDKGDVKYTKNNVSGVANLQIPNKYIMITPGAFEKKKNNSGPSE